MLRIGAENLCVTSDFIRGTEFLLFKAGYLSYEDLGYFLVTANISDLASMGAKPICIQTIVRYDDKLDDCQFAAVFAGIAEACEEYGCTPAGGDIGGHNATVLSATAIGSCGTKRPLTRKGAAPDEFLFVGGQIGDAAAALLYFTKLKEEGVHLSPNEEAELLRAWKKPTAHVALGTDLLASGLVTSCQDISDGLKATLSQMSAASSCCFEIDEALLPISSTTTKLCQLANLDPIAVALSASVDFSLAFTSRAKEIPSVVVSNQSHSHLGAVRIGRAINGTSNCVKRAGGQVEELPGIEWRHQSGSIVESIARSSRK